MPLQNRPYEHTFSNVEHKAVLWWEGKRGRDMFLIDHLANPQVHCASSEEKELAEECARIVKMAIAMGGRCYEQV